MSERVLFEATVPNSEHSRWPGDYAAFRVLEDATGRYGVRVFGLWERHWQEFDSANWLVRQLLRETERLQHELAEAKR